MARHADLLATDLKHPWLHVQEVLREFGDIVLAYGESDEYSFVFKKNTTLYGMIRSQLSASHCDGCA